MVSPSPDPYIRLVWDATLSLPAGAAAGTASCCSTDAARLRLSALRSHTVNHRDHWGAPAVATVQRWTGREARALREALRLSVRGFARYLGVAVRTVAAWDASGVGVVPRPEMQAALDTALGQASSEAQERFASMLAERDGYSRPPGGPGAGDLSGRTGLLAVAWEPGVDRVRRGAPLLWAADLDLCRAGEPDPAALEVVALRWLVAGPEAVVSPGASGRRVGSADVERVRCVRRRLKAVDHTHGGGAAFPMAVTYLRGQVAPLLGGRYSAATGRQLFGVIAGLTLDVGWMAYDAGDQPLARAYLAQALRLAHASGDRLLGGRVLAALSHQALHVGQVSLAIDCARAARTGTERVAPPRAVAMLAAMEAMALAAAREATACARALQDAEAALEQASPDDQPDRLDFDTGGLWGHAARAYRYLRRGRDCARLAEQAVAACQPDHGRTRAQRHAILAAGQVQTGELESAAATGLRVVRQAWSLHSRHVDEEITGLARVIKRRDPRGGREFLSEARDYLAAHAA